MLLGVVMRASVAAEVGANPVSVAVASGTIETGPRSTVGSAVSPASAAGGAHDAVAAASASGWSRRRVGPAAGPVCGSIETMPRAFGVGATARDAKRLTVFNHGNTGLAVRASASLPDIFWPVLIAGVAYVDGGLSSRVPVAVARSMGADVVVAVDVSWRGSDEVAQADVPIRPDTPRTRTLDFSARLESIAAGEMAGRDALPLLRERLAAAGARVSLAPR